MAIHLSQRKCHRWLNWYEKTSKKEKKRTAWSGSWEHWLINRGAIHVTTARSGVFYSIWTWKSPISAVMWWRSIPLRCTKGKPDAKALLERELWRVWHGKKRGWKPVVMRIHPVGKWVSHYLFGRSRTSLNTSYVIICRYVAYTGRLCATRGKATTPQESSVQAVCGAHMGHTKRKDPLALSRWKSRTRKFMTIWCAQQVRAA